MGGENDCSGKVEKMNDEEIDAGGGPSTTSKAGKFLLSTKKQRRNFSLA